MTPRRPSPPSRPRPPPVSRSAALHRARIPRSIKTRIPNINLQINRIPLHGSGPGHLHLTVPISSILVQPPRGIRRPSIGIGNGSGTGTALASTTRPGQRVETTARPLVRAAGPLRIRRAPTTRLKVAVGDDAARRHLGLDVDVRPVRRGENGVDHHRERHPLTWDWNWAWTWTCPATEDTGRSRYRTGHGRYHLAGGAVDRRCVRPEQRHRDERSHSTHGRRADRDRRSGEHVFERAAAREISGLGQVRGTRAPSSDRARRRFRGDVAGADLPRARSDGWNGDRHGGPRPRHRTGHRRADATGHFARDIHGLVAGRWGGNRLVVRVSARRLRARRRGPCSSPALGPRAVSPFAHARGAPRASSEDVVDRRAPAARLGPSLLGLRGLAPARGSHDRRGNPFGVPHFGFATVTGFRPRSSASERSECDRRRSSVRAPGTRHRSTILAERGLTVPDGAAPCRAVQRQLEGRNT